MGRVAQNDESVAADSESWSRLPDDVAMRVLARLPVAQLVRARAVCKKWNLLISAPELNLDMSCDGQSDEPYFPVVMSRGVEIDPDDERGGSDLPSVVVGYDHSTGAWQKLPPLDFLPREAASWVPVAAAGGFVCFKVDQVSRFFLCNPVARTCVELPPVAYKWTPLSSVHILVDHATGSYRVIMLGKIRHNYLSESVLGFAVYESSSRAWRFADAGLPSQAFTYGPTSAVCGGALYCGAVCRPSGQLGVMAYDIQAEAWQEVLHKIPPPPDDRSDYQLTQVVECGGAIYMVLARGYGGVGLNGVVSSMNVLKLEATTNHSVTSEQSKSSPHALKAWRQVTRLCDELLEDLQKGWLDDDDSGAIVCVGHGSRICISAGIGFILMYDVETGYWSRLPPCPQLFNLGVNVIAEPSHFPMELRLTSRV